MHRNHRLLFYDDVIITIYSRSIHPLSRRSLLLVGAVGAAEAAVVCAVGVVDAAVVCAVGVVDVVAVVVVLCNNVMLSLPVAINYA